MKKYIVSFAVATLVLSSVTGCIEEYSPEGYNNYVTIDQAAEAPGSYDNFVNNITTSLSGQFTYNGSKYTPWDFGISSFFLQRDVMGQDIALANSGSHFQGWYTCSIGLGPRYALCQVPWTYYYGWIKNCNTVILIAGEKPADKQKAGAGIAYAMRAMFYMDLARMYAPKTYAEDKNSPTVPKITEKAVEDMYNNPRMTNEEIFAFILSDLDKAEEYIAGYKRADKYTPDLSVVYGLKARAYLTMADWPNAEKYAKLAQQGYTEMTGEEYTSKTLGFNTANGAWMFATRFKSDDPNLRLNDSDSSWGSHMITEIGGSKGDCGYASNYGYPLLIDRHLYETIPATDFRKNCFVDFEIDKLATNSEKLAAMEKYSNEPSYVLKTGLSTATYGHKVGGLPVKFRPKNGACDQPLAVAAAVDVPLMRVEEMKLIEIEAVGRQNEAKGIEMLTAFAKKRDPQYQYGTHNEAYGNTETSAFVNEVWWQRRVEFWGEGFATFDIKRLKKGIIRSYANTNHFDGYQWNSKETPKWMTLCIIGTEADVNKALVNNPIPEAPTTNSPQFAW